MQTQININNQAVTEALEKLIARGQNLAPVMAEVANLLQTITEEAFDSETSAIDGTPWEDLKPLTVQSKQRRGTDKGRLLYDQSTMQSSLTASSDRISASVGVNAKANGFPYPIVHQFGTTKAGRGNKVTIPARPFFPIDADGNLPAHVEAEVLELLEGWFEV